ncbi:MAG: hypothetical protein J6J79_11425 [Lachnospiraceae bacterium]|nr:hypothetical protein [Lachnospiraceae bacterium]
MSKEEIALELTKISYSNALMEAQLTQDDVGAEEVVTNLYNYIYENLNVSEQNK